VLPAGLEADAYHITKPDPRALCRPEPGSLSPLRQS
jgi:hypothetical protein